MSPIKQLTTKEIDRLLSAYPVFKGTFPADGIPHIPERPAAVIVNTDPSGSPGEHWTAIVLKPNNKALYFDPLGFPPLIPTVREYLMRNAHNGFKYNAATLQSPTGVACGYWCIAFIVHWADGGTLRSFSSRYRGRSGIELSSNDEKLFSELKQR